MFRSDKGGDPDRYERVSPAHKPGSLRGDPHKAHVGRDAG